MSISANAGNLPEVKNTTCRWNSTFLGRDEFIVCNTIGSGGFGDVIKVIKKPTKNEFALKIVKIKSDPEEADKCYREVKALGKLTHSNIVRYYDSWTFKIPFSEYENHKDPNGFDYSSSSSDYIQKSKKDECQEVQYLCIQMELCEKQTLRDVIDDGLHLDQEKTSKYFKEICEGLDHIHQNGIFHRDLKPNNIFLTKGYQIKIGDFGLCKEKNDIIVNDSSVDNYRCGTYIYNAPELPEKTFDEKADIYSLGVIYLEMCSRPMTESEKTKLLIPLENAKLEIFFIESNINHHAKRLIKDLLNSDYKKRPTCEEILEKLNLQKTRAMIRDQIQDNKKICIPQQKIFHKILRSTYNSLNKREFFLETATAVFRLHGGHNISMPIFTPPYLHNDYSLTGLINESGYTVSLANSSRMAFCQYVLVNKLKDIARYSVGKVFVERHFLPLETIECSFQRISSTRTGYSAAEVFSIIKRVIDDTFKGHNYNLKFIINDGFLLKTLLNNCGLEENERTDVERLLFNLWEKIPSQEELLVGLNSYNLDSQKIRTILQCSRLFNFQSVKNKIQMICKSSKRIKQNLSQLEKIIETANLYGIESEDIYICPLLLTQKYWPNFMFKVIVNDKHMVAFGDRFDNLLNQSKRTKRSKSSKKIKMYGVDVSFVVDNVVELMEGLDVKSQPHLDVLIVSKKETITDAIRLHKKLLDSKISSEINNSQTVNNDCRCKIEVLGNCMVTVTCSNSNKPAIRHTNWTNLEFIPSLLFLLRPPQITYYPRMRSICF